MVKVFLNKNNIGCYYLPRGKKHADQIPLRGQGHEVPNTSNGDLIIIIRCEKT